MKQAHQFTGDVMKCLFTWTDCCLNHMLLLLWAILFYIVNANDANWERMTRHNKSSPNTIEYFQRFLFRILCRFFVLFSTCFFSPFWFACVRIFLSGNLFYFFFREREREKKVNVRPCGHLLLHVRETYEMILINMVMSEYENDDRTEKTNDQELTWASTLTSDDEIYSLWCEKPFRNIVQTVFFTFFSLVCNALWN